MTWNDDARMRRLERAELLAFVERHGLAHPELALINVQQLRAEVALDCVLIIREHAQPVMEERRAG
jgi:hypothetical protein